jgi:non-specific serine/threonine protein kinase
VEYLRGKRVLLILDTCEHLIDACAMLADVLLRGADGPRLLATSRQALDIPGEVVFPIPPLDVPDDGGDAVALFADRVSAAVPGFEITDDVLPRIVALCRGLDGIPLAIELAAVRLRAVGLDELLARLGDQLRLLAGGSRRVTQRHQTLRMTISWSYELCSPAERLLWTRLSVFAGEFGLDAVEEVCRGGELATADIIDTLIGLVDKSIVLRADAADNPDGARYQILDTVREFGAELLAEADSFRARHLEYYLALTRQFEPSFLGPDQMDWTDRLTTDQANIRVALEYSIIAGRPGDGLEIATSCWGFWMSTGLLSEGSYWLQRLLEQAPEPTAERVRGLWLASWFLASRGENAASGRLRVEAREIAAALGGGPRFPASMRRPAAVLRALRQVLRGAHAQALAICDETLDALPPGEKWLHSSALWVKSLALWFTRDLEGCTECLREGIELKLGFGDLMAVAHHLEGFAWLAADADQDHVRTARLQGAADRMWRQTVSEPRFGVRLLHAERDRAERLARDALGLRAYAAGYTAGAGMSLAAAVRYALGDVLPAGAPPAGTVVSVPAQQQPWEQLTARERQVATLVADGLTNKDIAARLMVSKRTVDAHVEHILGKLGYSSRVQIAALASAQVTSGGVPRADPSSAGTGAPGDAPVPAQRAAEEPLASRRTDRDCR